MAGYILAGTLAAMGLLSLLWVSFGWLLPGSRGGAFVCLGWPGEGLLGRCRWLRELGLLRCPMIIVTEEPSLFEKERLLGCGIELCGPGELLSRLERERRYLDGTGNGDPPGRGERRGISEL